MGIRVIDTNGNLKTKLASLDLSSTAVSGLLDLDHGGTGADLSATGPGALVQTSAGAVVAAETLDPSRGGTGVDNGSNTLTLGAALTVNGGGTLSLPGGTVTVPAAGTVALATGTPSAGNVADWSDANTVQDAGFAASDVARLSQANTFAGTQKVEIGNLAAFSAEDTQVTPTGATLILKTSDQEWRITNTYQTTSSWLTLRDHTNGKNTFNFLPSTGHLLLNSTTDLGQLTVQADAAGTVVAVFDTAASPTVPPLEIYENGVRRIGFLSNESTSTFNAAIPIAIPPYDNGSNAGPRIQIGRNDNVSTPAAGHLLMRNQNGGAYRIWIDGSGDMRLWSGGDPNNANDTSGTVVGTQTSWHELKTDITPWENNQDSLKRLLNVPLHEFRFKEDSQRRDKRLRGIVIFPEDREAWYSMNYHHEQAIPALDEAALFGELIGAVKALDERLSQLEAA